jgi:hypothetical protein
MTRCQECGGKMRVIDAPKLLLECTRCGVKQSDVCTCTWSPVNTTTIDPPHIVARDPNCPRHGDEADEAWQNVVAKRDDEAATRDEKDAQRRRDAADGFEEA